MRVLQVYKFFDVYSGKSGGGGISRHIDTLAKNLAKQGCDVTVVSPNSDTVLSPYKSISCSYFKLPLYIKGSDIVHVHGARTIYSFAAAIFALALGKKIFFTPHCYYDQGSRLKKLLKLCWDHTFERLLLLISLKNFALSEEGIDWYNKRKLPSHKSIVIPNCISFEELTTRAMSIKPEVKVGTPSVFYVGRLDRVKRVDTIIEAICKPGLEHSHLHIVGKGPEQENLAAYARKLGCDHRVSFYGFLSDNEVIQVAKSSDFYVLASEMEGLPTVILEMLAIGVPVISSTNPGNLAITEPLGIKANFSVGDADSLATLMLQRHEVSSDQISKLKLNFTWEERAKEILFQYSQKG